MIPYRSDPQKAQNGRKRRKAFFGSGKVAERDGLGDCINPILYIMNMHFMHGGYAYVLCMIIYSYGA